MEVGPFPFPFPFPSVVVVVVVVVVDDLKTALFPSVVLSNCSLLLVDGPASSSSTSFQYNPGGSALLRENVLLVGEMIELLLLGLSSGGGGCVEVVEDDTNC